eukprot:1316264-Rhodomonas_salina.2
MIHASSHPGRHDPVARCWAIYLYPQWLPLTAGVTPTNRRWSDGPRGRAVTASASGPGTVADSDSNDQLEVEP